MKRVYGYARVSTREQNLDRQIKALLDVGASEREIITDKASGASLEREGYLMLKCLLREGDRLVIKSLDRVCFLRHKRSALRNQNTNASQVNEGQETTSKLVIASGSAAKLLKFQ